MRERGTQAALPRTFHRPPWLHPWKAPRLKLGNDLCRHFIVKRIAVPAARRFTLARNATFACLTHGILLAPPQTNIGFPRAGWAAPAPNRAGPQGRAAPLAATTWRSRAEDPACSPDGTAQKGAPPTRAPRKATPTPPCGNARRQLIPFPFGPVIVTEGRNRLSLVRRCLWHRRARSRLRSARAATPPERNLPRNDKAESTVRTEFHLFI
jgi:hypothetical protein